jgi:hypothetical protein
MKTGLFAPQKGSCRLTFWLLLAAWFCANTPPVVTFHLMVWTGGARHFSHQGRLKADVALLLSGKKLPAAAQELVSVPTDKPAAPALPAGNVIKKIDLYASATLESARPAVRELKFPARCNREPDRARAEPLLTPPRGHAAV